MFSLYDVFISLAAVDKSRRTVFTKKIALFPFRHSNWQAVERAAL